MSFISCRRYLLDEKWAKSLIYIKPPIIDLGGVKENRRGTFQVPASLKDNWFILNSDPRLKPDYLESLPRTSLADSSFATAIITEVLEYLDSYEESISEIHRILMPDGLVILSVPFMSPVHFDKENDKVRFTESYLKSMLLKHFEIIHFDRMGSFLSVAMDGWRSNFYLISKPSIFQKVQMKIFRRFAKYIIKLEQIFFPSNEMANTGYWVIAKKKS